MSKKEFPTSIDGRKIHHLSNLDLAGRQTSKLFLASIGTTILLSIFFWFAFEGQTSKTAVGIQTAFCLLILFFWFLRKIFGRKPNNVLSPDTIFVSFYSIFHFAYIFLYSIGIAPMDPEVFWAPDKVLPAICFCLCCLSLFLLGYEIPGILYSRYPDNPVIEKVPRTFLGLSKIMLLVGGGLFFSSIIFSGIFWGSSDYQKMLNVGIESPLGRLFWFGQNIGFSGLVIYCAASGMIYRKYMTGFFQVVAWSYIFSMLLFGDRGGFIQLFVIPLISYHYFQEKIKLKWILILAVFLLSLTAVVGLARQAALGNVVQMIKFYKDTEEAKAYNPFVYSLIEFGTSVKTVVVAMKLVPEKFGYWKGMSYLESLTIIFPNIIPGFIRVSRGIVVWLTETAFGSLKYTHGRGGSIAMEAYVNFGFFGGILFFGILGFSIRCVYERFLVKPTFLRIVFLLGVMGGVTLWIRNSFSLFVRPAFWTLFIAFLLIVIFRFKHYPKKNEYQKLIGKTNSCV